MRMYPLGGLMHVPPSEDLSRGRPLALERLSLFHVKRELGQQVPIHPASTPAAPGLSDARRGPVSSTYEQG